MDGLNGTPEAHPRHLVGREAEVDLLRGAIAAEDRSGHAVLLVGDAGMGKTVLLEEVAGLARSAGMTVVVVRGAESEAVLPFGALFDLLAPFLGGLDGLPQAQRMSIEACLGMGAGPVHSPLAACTGALELLANAEEETRVVVLVDDLQWIDPDSAQVLLFVARRLQDLCITMVLARRGEPDEAPALPGVTTVWLRGLGLPACVELLRLHHHRLPGPTVNWLVEWTGGNPLALAEFARRIPDRPEVPVDFVLGGRPTLPASLEHSWAEQLARLSDPARQALYVLAADRSPAGTCLGPALAQLELDLEVLAPAEELGLVRRVGTALALRHPLLRTVILARSPHRVRTDGLRALAAVADDALRAWYVAASATAPDEEAAQGLVAVAGQARLRTGLASSAQILHRAAMLTPTGPRRGARLVQAALDAHLAGESSTAVRWCDEALTMNPDPAFMADVVRVSGAARSWLGRAGEAFTEMVRVGQAVRDVDPARSAVLLAEATAAGGLDGRVREIREVARQVEALMATSPSVAGMASPTMLAMLASTHALAGDRNEALRYVRRAGDLLISGGSSEDLPGLGFLGQALVWTEQFDASRAKVDEMLLIGRRIGSASALSFGLMVSAELRWWAGLWVSGMAEAREGLRWADENGQPGLMVYCLGLIARYAAGRGDRSECEASVAQAHRMIPDGGVGCLPVYTDGALALLALGGNDLAGCARLAGSAWRFCLSRGDVNPNAVPFGGDLAEALARAGRSGEAAEVTDWLTESAARSGQRYPAAVAARARGLIAVGVDDAESWLLRSLEFSAGGSMPFEHARTLLSLGERRRRARMGREAREPLLQAVQAFDRMGAAPWSVRARAELGAIGVRSPAAGSGALRASVQELTPQELHVARAVATGLNNIEVAENLFVSRKTVEAHLTRVYRKLGVRGRTEMARALLMQGALD